MDKIAKYYFKIEGLIFLGIIVSGFFDPAFLLFGTVFLGTAVTLIGILFSLVWRMSRKKAGGDLENPSLGIKINIGLFILIVIFYGIVFSGGIGFMM